MKNTWRAVALCGAACINIVSTLLPVWSGRFHLLDGLLPLPLILGAQHLTLFLGVLMLLVAYPAAEGHKRSAYIYIACAGVAIFSNLLKGVDVEEALLNLGVVLFLWRARRTFHSIPLRYTLVDVIRLGVILLAILRVYTLLERTILATLRHLNDTVYQESLESPRLGHIVLTLTADLKLQRLWFNESEMLLPGFLIGVFLVFSWTSLMRIRSINLDTSDLYARFGRYSHNSLAYISQRDDVSTFLDPEGRGAISYRLVGRVALQVGAILAPSQKREAVYSAFYEYCRSQRFIPAAVALSEEERPIAQRHGMRSLAIGNEALVDLHEFTVEKLSKKMRWAQRSLAKRGYTTELLSAADASSRLRSDLNRIDAEWRENRGGQSHGFCMTLGRFPTRGDASCLIGVMRDADGAPVAYLSLLPGGEGYYSLDLTRRLSAAPNAAMEYLLIEVLSALKARGATTVSLNFSTFSGVPSVPGGKALIKLCGAAFQLDSLETFNNKFRPTWTPRYLVLPAWYHAPDVLYAILIVEGVDRMLLNALVRATRRFLLPLVDEAQPQREPRLQGEGA